MYSFGKGNQYKISVYLHSSSIVYASSINFSYCSLSWMLKVTNQSAGGNIHSLVAGNKISLPYKTE